MVNETHDMTKEAYSTSSSLSKTTARHRCLPAGLTVLTSSARR